MGCAVVVPGWIAQASERGIRYVCVGVRARCAVMSYAVLCGGVDGQEQWMERRWATWNPGSTSQSGGRPPVDITHPSRSHPHISVNQSDVEPPHTTNIAGNGECQL